MKESEIIEKLTSAGVADDITIYELIDQSRRGLAYDTFRKIADSCPFGMNEWAVFLHLSERTLQRYQKQKKSFGAIHTEKIFEITMLYGKGIELFGDKNNFYAWLNSKNVALGGIKPKDLLDSSFGISLLSDELSRIDHGVLA